MGRKARPAMRVVGPAVRIAVFVLLVTALADYFNNTWGPVTFLCITALLVLALALVREIHFLAGSLSGRGPGSFPYVGLSLLLCSAGLTMAILELGLQVYQETGDRTAAALTIPEEWKKRPVVIEGARKSYYWHGKLHVHDESGMRRSSPFPAKEGGRCRVLVFGDSLTYGYGVSEEEAYPSLLERSLAGRYRLEVLNLGVSGRHSSGVLEAVKRLVPDLEPELVVYGVCLNDFLDPLEGEASNRRRHDWPFPLPEKFKREMLARTATAELLERGYDSLLMKLGLRLDFFDDILKGFDGYQVRFGSDVSEMNSFARQMGLPPVVAMTLDQFPGTDSRGREISRIAEGLMRGAGMTVVPTEQFYEEHHGRRMIVSPWEGHPNAEAHRLFADNLLEHLDGHPAIESCRIPAP